MKYLFSISILSFALLFVTNHVSAQLVVDEDGCVGVGTDETDYRIYLNIGDIGVIPTGYTNLYHRSVLADNKDHHGIYNWFYAADSDKDCIGIYSGANGTSNHTLAVVGDHSTSGGNAIGIYGHVVGASNNLYYDTFTGYYAGYFSGATRVDGTLTATQVITPSDIMLKENIVSLSGGEDESGSSLEKLMDMNVIKYNYKEPERQMTKEEEKMLADLSEQDLNAMKEYYKKCREERISQKHYGLSAQELQKIYPDLVIEGQDGKLGVNYLELVPILIRSIQELKQELDARTQAEAEAKTRGIADGDQTEKIAMKSTGNILYQNTPNPFKEQTVIRFSLADDAKDAAICIFDLSGKMLKKMPVTQGMTSVSVGGYELGEGMFLYTLMVNGQEIDTKRMIITK